MTIRVEREGKVLCVTIDRPEHRNAVDRATADALSEAFAAFEADDTLRVAILTGAGGHFCAGADLKAIASGEGNRIAIDGDGPMGPTRMECSKPIIAAVEGFAVAGGLELAIWCDLRIAAESATFGIFCRRWGVPLIDGGTIRLPRLIGLGRALDLILTGRPVSADEASRIGLVERVVSDGQALRAAHELAQKIASFPQDCLVADRANALRAFDQPIPDALKRELEESMSAVRSCVAGAQHFASGAGRGGTFDTTIRESE